MMTALSCVAIGLAFVIAVALLLLAGIGLGWVLPAQWRKARSVRRRTDGDA
jgi:hypothetical protein